MRSIDWLDPLYTAAEMRAVDTWAVERVGMPSLELMERAGDGLATAVADVAAGVGRGPVRILVGGGYNGADGLVAARLLRGRDHQVDVIAVGAALEEMRGDARVNLERLPGAPPLPFAGASLEGSAVVVDCLLGTGVTGAPRPPMDAAIAAINAAEAPVVAGDVPSGVDASTGEVAAEAVWARLTATFHDSKIGLWVAPGALHAGEVRVVRIAVPPGAPEPELTGLITPRVLDLVPHRPRHGSKFTSGTVVVAGGARGLTGAPAMAALSAMRTGAGYVQVAVPVSIHPALELRLLEAMTHGLPEEDGHHQDAGAAEVVEMSERAGAVVLGPGLGRSEGARAFARAVARDVRKPILLDADGLNAHVGALEGLRKRDGGTVLTPHAGELARLLGVDSADIDAHRLASARRVAEATGAVVVLKGDDSIVAAADGRVAVSPGSSPALATAGTGDVLSGVIAALLAKGLDPFEAAAAAVLAHGRAGRVAAERLGADHVIASDVIEALPAAFPR